MTSGGEPTVASMAVVDGVVTRVCYQRCWSCIGGDCFDPPQWHTYADSEDIDHAKANGHPDPSTSRCGCECSVEATS